MQQKCTFLTLNCITVDTGLLADLKSFVNECQINKPHKCIIRLNKVKDKTPGPMKKSCYPSMYA